MRDYLADVSNWSAAAAREWFREQGRNTYGHYFAYYKPSTKTADGEIRISQDTPMEGWHLGDTRRIQPSWTIRQVTAHLVDIARRWPILKSPDA